jgi:ABC-2 type transport system permease protein
MAVTLSRPALPPSAALRKWSRIFSIYLQDALAYRAVAVIWILTDTIPSIVTPLMWLAAYNGRSQIQGFSPSQITAYYFVLLGVTNLVQCHQMWEMAGDIKEGRFSAYLIRPFSYRVMNYLGFLSWRLMRTTLFIPVFFLAAYLFRDTLRWSDLHLSGPFFLSLVLGHLVSFFITYAFGLLALYFVETRSLFNFWYLPSIIFSGQLAPIEMFPTWLRGVAEVLPFRYTIALPTEILLGRLSPEAVTKGLLMQVLWIVVGWAVGTALWKNGLRRFTGVGL